MSSPGVMSSKEAVNDPGLCLVKGHSPGLSSLSRARNQFSRLVSEYYQDLANHIPLHKLHVSYVIKMAQKSQIVKCRPFFVEYLCK
jgi:hypothetical protein